MKTPINELIKVINSLQIGIWEENKLLYNLSEKDPFYSIYRDLYTIYLELSKSKIILNQFENIFGKVELDKIKLETTEKNILHILKLAQIGSLTTEIAHEMTQPLTYLDNFLYLLKNDSKSNKNMKKNFQFASEEIFRLINMVSHLQDFSRKDINNNRILLDLSEIFDRALTILDNNIKTNQILVKKDIDKKLPKILINPSEIEQVILNLLQNSIEALENNKTDPQISITVKYHNSKNQIIFEIKDNGDGIKNNQLNDIYKPFFTTKPPGKGTGLGLNIIKKIIDKYKGEINCETFENKGTSFIIKIPAQS